MPIINEYNMTPEDPDTLGIPREHTVVSSGFGAKPDPAKAQDQALACWRQVIDDTYPQAHGEFRGSYERRVRVSDYRGGRPDLRASQPSGGRSPDYRALGLPAPQTESISDEGYARGGLSEHQNKIDADRTLRHDARRPKQAGNPPGRNG